MHILFKKQACVHCKGASTLFKNKQTKNTTIFIVFLDFTLMPVVQISRMHVVEHRRNAYLGASW